MEECIYGCVRQQLRKSCSNFDDSVDLTKYRLIAQTAAKLSYFDLRRKFRGEL